MPNPQITLDEHAQRRESLLEELGNSIGLVFAGDHDAHLVGHFRPHPNFEYLTGVTNEPGAVLMLDPTATIEQRRAVLFLKPLNPEVEKWDGYRLEISKALRDRTGFKTVQRITQLPKFLQESVKRARSLACLHPLAMVDQPVSPDLEMFHKIIQRIPGTEIVDHSEVLAQMRSVKSDAEVAMIEHAVKISSHGYAALMKGVKPGISEFDAQEILEHAYRTHGSRGTGYDSIVGSGINSTVLHYKSNDHMIEDGDVICIDSGAAFGGYGADITRTIPANGTFTSRQREIYSIVLDALLAGIDAARPGARFADIDKAARSLITKAGFGDAFIHGIGHHLGLEIHDITPDGELEPGNVITIEPGIYLPDEKIGVRIEDDVVITGNGCRNLSAMIPKTIEDVQAAMATG